MAVAEKPSVLERLGSAMNSSDLSPRDGKIGAIELLGALAYTQTNPDAAQHAAKIQRDTGLKVDPDEALIDPRTRLARNLVRIKYGGDRAIGDETVLLLTHWVQHQKAFRKWKLKPGSDDMLKRFVRHSLAEWLFPVCEACRGRTLLGMDKGEVIEKRIRCTRCSGGGVVLVKGKSQGVRVQRECLGCGGKGWRMYRRPASTKARECNVCRGTGRRRPNDSERANALGVEHRVYARHWLRRFDWLASGLDKLDLLQRLCLQSQMRAGINPP